jgi:hypothetical protein
MFWAKKNMRADRAESQQCSEKDTSRNKLLQRGARFRRNVAYFAVSLGKAIGN